MKSFKELRINANRDIVKIKENSEYDQSGAFIEYLVMRFRAKLGCDFPIGMKKMDYADFVSNSYTLGFGPGQYKKLEVYHEIGSASRLVIKVEGKVILEITGTRADNAIEDVINYKDEIKLMKTMIAVCLK